ncbi:MAG: UDP-N-acetylmuramoyl-L-alanine--D-glutamate ligase [Bacteroidia bacterium]|nr:MAG: UDP-N-acetylmuramoyl-L-alanine--D-glutamate ligase [Bacteroidia bacterium]PIE86413.1 MAG: UDP-N-acetylmuramoyl-L-alanine--D-glutamate ligase [Bacteroidia bacterium]
MKKRIAILGAGESGIGAAVLAKKKGYEVFVSDCSEIKQKYKKVLTLYAIDFEEKKHTKEKIINADEIIKSPGIPEKAKIIQEAAVQKIPILSEIEFAGRFTKAKKICVTGSNGKTTTSTLIYHILKNTGLNIGLAGNVGKSFAMMVANQNFDYYVLELSSFQLDNMKQFKADIAILLNITPDHLDRYDNKFENYIHAKFKIAQNQSKEDYFIYGYDDPVVRNEMLKREINAKKIAFSVKETLKNGAYLENNDIKINIDNKKFNMNKNELSLTGIHNINNSMAAGIAAKLMDIRNDSLRECLQDFRGVEHRLEKFIKVHGILFINDSKATNVNSTWYALESMTSPTVWIVGGVDKGNDYSSLKELVADKVKAIVCLGSDKDKIYEAFSNIKEIYDAASMEEAVRTAYYLANDGEVVLLSPACASFDLFDNYQHRGNLFKEVVSNL